MDLLKLVEDVRNDPAFKNLLANPLAQFGTGNRQYLGATVLPERLVPENEYTEEELRINIPLIANDGSRYNPVQRKGTESFKAAKVSLGNIDIGRQLTARDYDTLVKLMNASQDMEAMVQLISWVDRVILGALLDKEEKQRWDAIVNARVVRTGDNGYTETVDLPGYNAANTDYRFTPAAAWSLEATDPFADIYTIVDHLESLGYRVRRIIAGATAVNILLKNPKVAARLGSIRVSSVDSGLEVSTTGRLTLAQLNGVLGDDELPPIEKYTLRYNTITNGTKANGFFLPQDSMVFIGETDRTESINDPTTGEQKMELQGTLGYYAIGRAAGQPSPGRVTNLEAFYSKPPRIEAEGYQTSFPVILDYEAIGVIKGIS